MIEIKYKCSIKDYQKIIDNFDHLYDHLENECQFIGVQF
jgi:hypothetical protein